MPADQQIYLNFKLCRLVPLEFELLSFVDIIEDHNTSYGLIYSFLEKRISANVQRQVVPFKGYLLL